MAQSDKGNQKRVYTQRTIHGGVGQGNCQRWYSKPGLVVGGRGRWTQDHLKGSRDPPFPWAAGPSQIVTHKLFPYCSFKC